MIKIVKNPYPHGAYLLYMPTVVQLPKKVNLMLDFICKKYNIQLMMVNSSTLLFNMLFLVLYLTLGSLLSVLNALVWTNKSDNNMMVRI